MSEEETYGAPRTPRGAMDEGQQRQHAMWKREMELKHKGCVLKVLNGKHCLVIGLSGSGKTFWAKTVADQYLHRFLFINPQIATSVTKICKTHYDDPNEVIEGVLDGDKAIEFIPSEDVKEAILELEIIRRGLFDIAIEIGAEEESWWMNVLIDEVQNYAWKGAHNDLDNFGTRGRGFGIRSFFITQRPQNVSSTIINEVQHQVIFEFGSYENEYFRRYKIDIESQQEWLRQQYYYVLYDNREFQQCLPIEE